LKRKDKDGNEVPWRREMGLGPNLGLKEARIVAKYLRADIRSGSDPLDDKEQRAQNRRDELAAKEREAAVRAREAERTALTLAKFADDYHRSILGGFDNAKHSR